ncbi:hypothetical protein HYG86_07980 [Alkalicella caledoniensis]|uniref:Uncharacterized protein n=1 Tax=Alkalicella caledoniensis TaxID=2731377 RepID=A0A7G9W7R7_ALKCA|nr:hypothetical protein [Alkalicella caledoniensis]QNO14729.1 hypothetical protein HYG86_07980 [Alkalicella caledoniensis]
MLTFSIISLMIVAFNVTFFSVILGIPQYFLSKSDNRWFGLILPILSLAYTTVFSLTVLLDEFYLGSILIFLIFNISTIIFLAIYWYVRKHIVKKSEIRKMTIKDLE